MASDLNSSDCLQSETGNKLVNNDEVVCVTGAGGFIGSWLVKRLLEKGYHVRGAVRNPDDEKNIRHLKALEGAEERLTLLKAQLSDLKSLLNAFSGCQGVFHLACSLKDDRNQVIEDAVRGTWNVIDACAEAGVKRMVMTSTIGTIYMDPNRNPDTVVDEECWSDLDYCIQTNSWYCYAKTVAEKGAFERAKEKNLDLVVVNPSLVLGPLLQPTVNASNAHILKYLTGSAKTYANMVQAYVHVKDVAEAHILVYENPKANGRYLCAEIVLHRADLVRILAEMFPQFPHPTKCSDEINPRKKIYPFSTAKLKSLGFHNFIPIHQALAETVASLEEKGFIRPLQEH